MLSYKMPVIKVHLADFWVELHPSVLLLKYKKTNVLKSGRKLISECFFHSSATLQMKLSS